ncbi:hypothetical protein [Alteromonas gilva]|uniref:Uncharacterized protein n=1 Tax=Alteromonas gilva TaxID=2987522 RepID=A0ABT5L758_9ALTE|nr:hypothetical protein [Alteromonas gilva]MDC8832254.1 hypothetical protein [Alteromonas gilva]
MQTVTKQQSVGITLQKFAILPENPAELLLLLLDYVAVNAQFCVERRLLLPPVNTTQGRNANMPLT